MSYLKTVWYIIFASISIISVAQQRNEVKGRIVNNTNEGIPDASIQIQNSTIGTKSIENGEFKISGLADGQHVLLISAVGFKKASVKINTSSIPATLRISLEKDLNQLSEVNINGKTQSKKIKETGLNVNIIETRQYANTNADINQILNRSTGVRIREQGGLGSDFTFSLNGLSGNYINFFIDGIPIESFGSGMTLNNMPVNIAERIEVYKGVIPAHLGSDALGGAVNIVTNRDKKKFLDVSYSYGSFNTHRAAVSGGFKDKNGIMVNVNSYYNYSDNDYLMKSNPKANFYLTVPNLRDDSRFDTLATARRFHDHYRSAMGQLEVGVADKKWADVAVLGITYNDVYKQQQTGATQEKVIGLVDNKSHSITPSIRYRKNRLFIDNLSATLFSNINISKGVITDTSSYAPFFWDGKAREYRPNAGEFNSTKSISHDKSYNTLTQANLNYAAVKHHVFNLNYNLNINQRERFNEIDPYNQYYNKTNKIARHILGLNYQQNLFGDKWVNSYFLKNYILSGKVDDVSGKSTRESSNFTGYGIASSYTIFGGFGIKASYEHAYRLPTFTELYGNGLEIEGNPNLKPANSDNYNINFFYNTAFGDHSLSFDASAFYRNAKDYIISQQYEEGSNGSKSQSKNQGGVKINGADFEAKYTYQSWLKAMVNMSYYNAQNREKYIKGTENRVDITYGSRTPNEPWLYGNADVSALFRNPFGTKESSLVVNYYLQFVNSYSLSWSKLGGKQTKDYIPEQWLNNLAVTYSMKDNKYHITLEGKNLTDQIAYDVFKQQKPGRSFSVKLRYSIQ